MRKFPKNLLVDTCFWFALYRPKDQNHAQAIKKAQFLDKANIIIPWPCLYETLNTPFVKSQDYVQRFEKIVQLPNTILIDDTPFREDAYKLTWDMARQGKRPISLVDQVIRCMLINVNVKVHYMLTFNIKDFTDLCKAKSIPFL